MRDSNGLGNIYFDDLFVNGIPYYSVLFYVVNGGLALVNLIALPIFFYGCYINSGYHKNYRLVSINVYVSFFLSSCGNFVYAILVLSRISDKNYEFLYYIFRFEAAFGAALWRSAFLSMVLERTAATMFYKTYEREGSPWLAASLVLFALMLAFVIPLAYFVVKVKFFMVIGIVALLDCAGILSVSLLFWSNKVMRRLKFISQIILTQRYQITENLRILHIIIPLIIVGTIFDFIALAGASLQTMLDFNTQLYYPSYYAISNLYVSIAFGLLLKYNEKSRKRISTLLFNKYQSSVEPELGNITNVDGRQIVINETPDIHFNQLALSWK